MVEARTIMPYHNNASRLTDKRSW